MKRLQALRNFTAPVGGRKTRWRFAALRGEAGKCIGDDITLSPCQTERDLMGTVIHEWLHRTLPDLSEDAVIEREEELVYLLWDIFGYRRTLS